MNKEQALGLRDADAVAAVRTDAVAEERARVIGLHTPEWEWHQKETSQRDKEA